MNIETKLTEILVSVFIISIILMPFIIIMLLISNINKAKYIKDMETKINTLQFEKEYLEFVYDDNVRQNT